MTAMIPSYRTQNTNAYLPWEAEVVKRVQESDTIFTLQLRLTDPKLHEAYRYSPGQFNMLYLYGVGEVAISIVSDPEHEDLLTHTINRVGRGRVVLPKCRKDSGLGFGARLGGGGPCVRRKVRM